MMIISFDHHHVTFKFRDGNVELKCGKQSKEVRCLVNVNQGIRNDEEALLMMRLLL